MPPDFELPEPAPFPNWLAAHRDCTAIMYDTRDKWFTCSCGAASAGEGYVPVVTF